ncbi:GWxTD domain-containing protein [candidate division KSB1 bacterium]|nr:GWxTD domain-containing protein [candidate division KSB1 bacterium]
MRKVVHCILLIVLSILLSTIVFAEEKADDASKGLEVGFDYVSFRGAENYTYVELYFSVYTRSLLYQPDGDRFKCEFQSEIQLYQNDSLITEKVWRNSNVIDSLAQQHANQKLFTVNYVHVKPGLYDMHIKFMDVASEKSVENKIKLDVPSFESSDFCMSELQLASDIKRAESKNQYFKNGYQVIPNTEHLYGIGLPILMFYFELYNIQQPDEPDTTQYEVKYTILNSNNEPVRNFPARIKNKPGNSAVEIGGVNIITLLSGTYFLQLDVHDLYADTTISKTTKFFVYRAGDYEQTPSDSMSATTVSNQRKQMVEGVYQVMSEPEIDSEFDACTYIATREEKKIFKNLDISGKRDFMVQFWAKRDEAPNTPRNEYRDDYIRRVHTAEKEFGSSFKKGWKVDEGRILLIYGVPDEIERFPSSTENKAYRTWHYYSVQGGVIFVFVDRRQWGEYELVHSTARGELYDEDWTRWIDPNQ